VSVTAPVVVGADLGTSTAKAVAFLPDGTRLAGVEVGVPPATGAPHRAEQDPEVLVAALGEAVRRTVTHLRRSGHRVDAIGLSGAMHSLVGLDATGHPLTPVMIWADRRATSAVRALAADPEARALPARTGTPLAPMSPLAKLRAIADDDPSTASAVVRWCSAKEYVISRWFGDAVVDPSTASATGLFDVREHRWDAVALRLARVTAAQLSTPVPATTILRGMDPAVAAALGVAADLPLVVGGADGCLAPLGAGAVVEGLGSLTIGTSGAVRQMVDRPATDATGRLFCYALDARRWVIGGPISNGGLVLRWLRDRLLELGGADAYDRIDAMVAGVPPGADGVVAVPSLTGERAPRWDAEARGAVVGLTAATGREHVARALLEGVAHALEAVLRALRDAGHHLTALRADGGFLESSVWPQIVADVLELPLELTRQRDGPVRGAALLTFEALGVGDALELARGAEVAARIEPDPATAAVHAANGRRFTRLRELLSEAEAEEEAEAGAPAPPVTGQRA
jgi:gluconokinase